MSERPRLRFGGYQGADSVHSRALRVLADEIRRVPGLDIEIVENVTAQGRRAVDLLDMVERGELDLCYFASSYLADRVPALRALDLPFVVSDRRRAYDRLDGALGARLGDEIARVTGFQVLGYWDNGFRHISNHVRPIRSPEDCRGLRLRTMASTLHHEIFAALGFEPVAIDVKDLAEAVRSHLIDAQENPLTNTVNFGLHRTHGHVSLTSHFFGVAPVLVNRARYRTWPEPVREAVRAGVRAATRAQRGFAVAEDADCLRRLRGAGVQVLDESEIDRAAFEAAVAGIRRRELARLDRSLAAELES